MLGFWDLQRWKRQRQGARFVSEKEGKVARRELENLLSVYLLPHLKQILTQLGASTPEVGEAAQALLTQQLGTLREKKLPLPELHALTERVAYEAVAVAHNAHQPARRRLHHRVLYLLRNRADRFTLEKSELGTLVAGAQGARPLTQSSRWQRLLRAPATAGAALTQGLDWHSTEALAVLLERLLTEVGHQVPVAQLVSVLATLSPEPERSVLEPEQEPTGGALSEKLEAHYLLRQVWEALPLLPVRQRVILLLGVQGRSRESLLPLLVEQGIATEAELAQTMEIGARSFPLLLRELPCDDTRLAELLKLTPENIRQLRQSARLKLGNLLSLWGEEPS